MKVLLINPTHNYDRGDRPPSYFPLGLGYIGRYLLKNGYKVETFDIWAHQWPKEEVIRRIPELDYDIAMISGMVTQYKYIKWLSKELKKHHNGPIVLGGGLAMFSANVVLRNMDVDICVQGDGELIAPDIVKNLDNLYSIAGITYKTEGQIYVNPPADLVKNLDDIEFPAWELFPLDIYLGTPGTHEGYFGKQMNIISGRGCPYQCNFCSKIYKTTRIRSPENVALEIRELQSKFGVHIIEFTEELVMISSQRMLKLCEALKQLNIKWSCQGRINHATLEVLKAMKDAGCTEVGYGIESGSRKILDAMNKNSDPELALQAIENTRKAGLRPVPQMMYGYPGENDETLKETIEWCNKAHVDVNNLSLLTPIPGTPVYDKCIADGRIKNEDEYLETLEGTGTFMVNLTGWRDEELLRKKKEAEDAIHKNYYKWRRTNPLQFSKEYLYKAKRFYGYVKKHGPVKAVKDAYKLYRKNPDYIFQAEYQ